MTSPRAFRSILAILIVAFLVNITPLTLYFMHVYRRGYETIEGQVTQSMIAETRFIMDDLDSEIGTTVTRLYELLAYRATNTLVLSEANVYSTYDKLMAKLDLAMQLSLIVSSSSYIRDITIYFPERALAISALTNIRTIGPADMEYLHALLSSGDGKLFTYVGSTPYLVAQTLGNHRRVEALLTRLPAVIISAEISGSSISTVLASYTSGIEREMRLIRVATGEQLATSGGSVGDRSPAIDRDPPQKVDSEGNFDWSVDGQRYFVSHSSSDDLGWRLEYLVPASVVSEALKAFGDWVPVSVAVVLGTIVLFAVSVYSFIYRPTHVLMRAFQNVEKGDLSVKLAPTFSTEFAALFDGFNRMTANLQHLIHQEYVLGLLAKDAELKQLQLQINPHFLYNSFFILRSMIREEELDSAQRLSDLLGRYLNYISHSTSAVTTLGDEVEHARAYAEIQQLRFSRRLRIDFEQLPHQAAAICVPRLVLQPLIENALEHGVQDSTPRGEIRIWFRFADQFITIVVEDNGSSMTAARAKTLQDSVSANAEGVSVQSDSSQPNAYPDELPTGIALTNIHRRLVLMYGSPSGLTFSVSDLGGLCVQLIIRHGGDSACVDC